MSYDPNQRFLTFVPSGNGILCAIQADGNLLWYRYILTDATIGAGSWHPATGSQIGSGVNKFARLIGGWNGVLYGLTAIGEMYWYRYAANSSTNQ